MGESSFDQASPHEDVKTLAPNILQSLPPHTDVTSPRNLQQASVEDLQQSQAPNLQTAQVLSQRSQAAGIQLSDSAQYAIQAARRARENKMASTKSLDNKYTEGTAALLKAAEQRVVLRNSTDSSQTETSPSRDSGGLKLSLPRHALWQLPPRNSPERSPRKTASILAPDVPRSNSVSPSRQNTSPSRYCDSLRNSPERPPRTVALILAPDVPRSNSVSPSRPNTSRSHYSAQTAMQQAHTWRGPTRDSPERSPVKVALTMVPDVPRSNSNSPSRTNISPSHDSAQTALQQAHTWRGPTRGSPERLPRKNASILAPDVPQSNSDSQSSQTTSPYNRGASMRHAGFVAKLAETHRVEQSLPAANLEQVDGREPAFWL